MTLTGLLMEGLESNWQQKLECIPDNRSTWAAFRESCPVVRVCQPPTPPLSCIEEFDWNDRRVSARNISGRCRLDPSIVRVGKNGVYMTAHPFLAAEDARANFHRKVVRQYIHRFMVIHVVQEDESHDRRFLMLDVAVPLFVKEITELHPLVPVY